jgi:L-ascorbate metabolism protein UlaG (beta-lactamase superfamily)
MRLFMYIALSIVILVTFIAVAILQQRKFGKLPSGARLERIRKSPNYRNKSFQNQRYTPVLTEGVGFFQVSREFFFGKKVRITPTGVIPSIKTDLIHQDKDKDILVWFGHSSYFMQIDGKRILVDPVLSGNASPFSFSVKAFKGTNPYSADDIPDIDYLFISHDHWDHLDYETIMKLKPKIRKVICGLGVGEDFEYWGFDKDAIIEMDWNEQVILDSGFVVNAAPARHFSGRGLKRNQTLWLSFAFRTPTMNIYIGGDGGYDKHFSDIGKTFGPFDLAILENGQYNKNWRYIHQLPEDVMKTFKDLNARRLLPVHSSKFALAIHPWDEPLITISKNSEMSGVSLITPMIGEAVYLKDNNRKFSRWWENVD